MILAGNPTTGYSWTAGAERQDAAVLQQQGDPVYAQESTDPSLVGAGGTFTFTFKAAAAGTGDPEVRLRPSVGDGQWLPSRPTR